MSECSTSCTTVDDVAWGTLLQLGELEELALMGMGVLVGCSARASGGVEEAEEFQG